MVQGLVTTLAPLFPYAAGFAGVVFVVTFIGFYRETGSMSLTWLRMLSLTKHVLRLKKESVAPDVPVPPTPRRRARDLGTISAEIVPPLRPKKPHHK